MPEEFEITPAMRRYLAAFDRYLGVEARTVPAVSRRARHDMREALGDMRTDAAARPERTCLDCPTSLEGRHRNVKRCAPCWTARRIETDRARRAVAA